MSSTPTAANPGNSSAEDADGQTRSISANPTIVPQAALDAADAKIASWSTAIVDAADTIEQLVTSESLPVPDGVRDLATSTTDKLRSFGTRSGEQDAAELVAKLQRTAAAHPAAAIGVGAAIGAVLAAVLVKMGAPAATGATDPSGDNRSGATSTSRAKTTGQSSAAVAGSPTNNSETKSN